MPKIISMNTKELEPKEMARLLADKTYSRYLPTKCDACGHAGDFSRRIFRVTGIPKSLRSDDNTQHNIRYHFFHQEKIDYIYFRSYEKGFYVDSAGCPKCKSTRIVYEVTFDDEVIEELARRLGTDPDVIKAQLEEMSGRIEKGKS